MSFETLLKQRPPLISCKIWFCDLFTFVKLSSRRDLFFHLLNTSRLSVSVHIFNSREKIDCKFAETTLSLELTRLIARDTSCVFVRYYPFSGIFNFTYTYAPYYDGVYRIDYGYTEINSPEAEWTTASSNNSKQDVIHGEDMLVITLLRRFFRKNGSPHLRHTAHRLIEVTTRLLTDNARRTSVVIPSIIRRTDRPTWRGWIFARIETSTLHLRRPSVYWYLARFMRTAIPRLSLALQSRASLFLPFSFSLLHLPGGCVSLSYSRGHWPPTRSSPTGEICR